MAKQRKTTIRQHAHQQHLVGKINDRLNKVLAILRRPRGTHTYRSISQELQVSYDTAKRAVERMRQDHGYPIKFDRDKGTFTCTEKISDNPELLTVQFTRKEIRVARLGAKALLTCPESGLGQTALKVHQKLSALVPDIIDVDNDDEILAFGFTSKPIYRRGVLKAVINAKEARRRIRMNYETDRHPPEWREVDLYSCVVVNECYYVIGYCHTRKKRLTFCATRVWDVEELNVRYEIPKTFKLKKYLRGNFGIVGGGKKSYKIVVRFQKEKAYLIKERIWAGEKKKVILPDGSVELHVQLRSLWEFERWLKGFPGRFSVLAPLDFRKAISDAGMQMHLDNKVD